MHEGGLVKTVEFKNPKYVGDPINAVKIFNEKEADELIVLDIDATAQGREPDYKMIADVAAECRMPMCYGGGIRTPAQAKRIIGLGVEKVALSSAAIDDSNLVSRIGESIGRQSVVVVLDVRKLGSSYEICTHNGTQHRKLDVVEAAKRMQSAGAGEIVINSIDRDGQMKGYDLALAKSIRRTISIPMTVLGGAGSLNDISRLITECGVVGAAAGSLFVFKGVYRAVLINYPNQAQKDEMFFTVTHSASHL